MKLARALLMLAASITIAAGCKLAQPRIHFKALLQLAGRANTQPANHVNGPNQPPATSNQNQSGAAPLCALLLLEAESEPNDSDTGVCSLHKQAKIISGGSSVNLDRLNSTARAQLRDLQLASTFALGVTFLLQSVLTRI